MAKSSGGAGRAGRGGDSVERGLNAKISQLNQRIDSANNARHNSIMNSNPAADTGGLRNQSARSRERFDNALFSKNRQTVDLINERNRLSSILTNYRTANQKSAAIQNLLKKGEYKGKKLTSEFRRDLQSELKLQNRIITRAMDLSR